MLLDDIQRHNCESTKGPRGRDMQLFKAFPLYCFPFMLTFIGYFKLKKLESSVVEKKDFFSYHFIVLFDKITKPFGYNIITQPFKTNKKIMGIIIM